jgi:predicted SAM-dependent methyltransferase
MEKAVEGDTVSNVIKLNLGCGCIMLPSPWVNVDSATQVVPSGYRFRLQDLRMGLKEEDNSVSAIVSNHFVDHLYVLETVKLLIECRRVMKPGAVMRFSLMSLEDLLDAYALDEMGKFASQQPKEWAGFHSDALKFSLLLFGSMSGQREYTGHWWASDYDGVRELCEMAGFTNIEQAEYGKSQDPSIELLSLDSHPNQTIYVEVKK